MSGLLQNIFQGIANAVQGINAVNQTLKTIPLGTTSSYPTNATPVTASSGNVANASAVATLLGEAGQTTYLVGFIVTSSGSTSAASVALTVAGVIGGTMTFTYSTVAGATSPNAVFAPVFPIPIPASATDTNIVVTLAALGAGNTRASVVAFGYRL